MLFRHGTVLLAAVCANKAELQTSAVALAVNLFR